SHQPTHKTSCSKKVKMCFFFLSSTGDAAICPPSKIKCVDKALGKTPPPLHLLLISLSSLLSSLTHSLLLHKQSTSECPPPHTHTHKHTQTHTHTHTHTHLERQTVGTISIRTFHSLQTHR